MIVSVFGWTDTHLADVEVEVSLDGKSLTVDTSNPDCNERILRFGNYVEIEGRLVRIGEPVELNDSKTTYVLYEVSG